MGNMEFIERHWLCGENGEHSEECLEPHRCEAVCPCGSDKPEKSNLVRYVGGYMRIRACAECLCEMCYSPHSKHQKACDEQ